MLEVFPVHKTIIEPTKQSAPRIVFENVFVDLRDNLIGGYLIFQRILAASWLEIFWNMSE